MGTKRVGLARVEALLENLKREINLSGSTLCAPLGACVGTFGAPPIVLDDDSTVADGGDNLAVIHQYSDGLRFLPHLLLEWTIHTTLLITRACSGLPA